MLCKFAATVPGGAQRSSAATFVDSGRVRCKSPAMTVPTLPTEGMAFSRGLGVHARVAVRYARVALRLRGREGLGEEREESVRGSDLFGQERTTGREGGREGERGGMIRERKNERPRTSNPPTPNPQPRTPDPQPRISQPESLNPQPLVTPNRWFSLSLDGGVSWSNPNP